MTRRDPSPPADEELVGYLLDALDEPAQRAVVAQLRASPARRRQLGRLRAALAPLESDRDESDPPPDLVANTLALIARQPERSLPSAPRLGRAQAVPRGWWRRSDVLVASALLLVTMGLAAGWIAKAGRRSQITTCQDNLQRFHGSLDRYADRREDSTFPRVEASGPHAFAGVFIPILTDAGVLTTSVSLSCPGREERTSPVEMDRVRRLEEWYRIDRPRYERAVVELAGSYAYSLGYRDRNGLQGLRRGAGMDRHPIMADCPPFSGRVAASDGNSRDHGGMGQNVLYIDGSVRFVTSRVDASGDDIYLNEDSLVLAGVREGDSVLAASDASP